MKKKIIIFIILVAIGIFVLLGISNFEKIKGFIYLNCIPYDMEIFYHEPETAGGYASITYYYRINTKNKKEYIIRVYYTILEGKKGSHYSLEVNKLIATYKETQKPHSGYSYPFDEGCLQNLKLLVKTTGSKLVITSIWRKDEEGKKTLLNALKDYELDTEVIGYTPIFGEIREREIKKFLSQLPYSPNFIILDDDGDMGELLPHLIKTNQQVGLTSENVEEAIKKLNKNLVLGKDDMER